MLSDLFDSTDGRLAQKVMFKGKELRNQFKKDASTLQRTRNL